MSVKIEMIGRTFGELVVLREAGSSKGHLRWLCKCSCGNETVVDGGNLRSGHTSSCGHCEKFEDLGNGVSKCILPNGKYFLFDTEDMDVIKSHKWNIPPSDYVETTIYKDGKQSVCRLHRALLNAPKGLYVDHINGKRCDNRKCNLRIATNKENIRNQTLSRANKSGYKGVWLDRKKQKYEASIAVDGKKIFLGYYEKAIEAALAYDKAASFYFGEYAKPNFGKGGIYGEVLELETA